MVRVPRVCWNWGEATTTLTQGVAMHGTVSFESSPAPWIKVAGEATTTLTQGEDPMGFG